MVRAFEAGGYLNIIIDGERSHLDGKALCSLLGRVVGRGKVEGKIGQQNIRIVVANEGTGGGEAHQAVDP